MDGYPVPHQERAFDSSGVDVVVIQNEQMDEIVMRNINGGAFLRVKFDPGRGLVSWECDEKTQRGWEIAVTETGGARFQWSMIPDTPDSMAIQMLNRLLGI